MQFGGMERLAVFVDLDCRFDVLRFSQLLKHKLSRSNSKLNLSIFLGFLMSLLCIWVAEIIVLLFLDFFLKKKFGTNYGEDFGQEIICNSNFIYIVSNILINLLLDSVYFSVILTLISMV